MSSYSIFAKMGLDGTDFEKSISAALGSVKTFNKELNAQAAQINREFSGLTGIGKKLAGIGEDLSKYVTLPLVAVGAAGTKMAADVDKGLREVQTLFGATGDEGEVLFKKLQSGVEGLSNEIGIAQDVLTKGLYNAISAGIPEENVFDFMRVAAKASIAGVTDVNTAVDGITTAINAFGLEASDAGRIADSMFAAVQGGKTTFDELSKSLFNIAPAAAAAGVSMEEVNAAIAAMTASGVPTSVATTQLRAALTGLQKPSEDLNKVFQALGYESAQVAIESEGLGFALDAVKKASNGNNGELQKMLGSVEAVAAANILAGTSAEKFADELDRQAKAAGATDVAFETMAKSTAQQFQQTMVLLQNIAISIGNVLLPSLNKLLDGIKDVVRWFADLDDSTKQIIVVVGGVVAAIGPAVLIFGKLLASVATIVNTLAMLKTGLALLLGPVGLVVGALTALAAIAVTVYKNWEAISDWMTKTFPGATSAFIGAWDSIKRGVNAAWDGIQSFFTDIKDAYSSTIDSLRSKKSEMENALGFTVDFEKAMETSISVMDNYVASAINGIKSMFSLVGDAVRFFFAGMTSDWRSGWESIKSIANTLYDAILFSFVKMSDSLLGVMESIFGWHDDWGTRIGGVREKLNSMVPASKVSADLGEIEAANKQLISSLTDTGIEWESVGKTSEESARKQEDQQRKAREEVEKTTAAIANLVSSYVNSMSSFDREIEIGVRVSDGADDRLVHEIETLVQALKSAAKDVNIDINSEDILVLRQRLFEAKADLMGLANQAGPSEVAIHSMTSHIDDASAALVRMSTDTQNAISEKVWQDGKDAVSGYSLHTTTEIDKIKYAFHDFIADAFPPLEDAFFYARDAFIDFRSAFKGENDKSFLENLTSGFYNVAGAIESTKGFMNEFGTVSGLVLGAINAAAPALGSAIMGLSAVFEALGIDIKGALNSISDSIAKLFEQADMGPLQYGFDLLRGWLADLNKGFSDMGGNTMMLSAMQQMLQEAESYADFIEKVSVATNLSTAQVEQAFGTDRVNQLKQTVWPGVYDPNTGQTAQVSPELQAQIMAALADLQASGNFTNQEIYDILKSQFTKTPLITLGIPQMLGVPALAKGGLAYGPTLAIVGDNPNAAVDPEVISPLSRLSAMIRETVQSVSMPRMPDFQMMVPAMMPATSGFAVSGNTSVINHITVVLDGERIQEFTTRGMVDTLRRNGLV